MSEEIDIAPVLVWLEERRALCGAHVEEIPLSQIRGWRTDPESGTIEHESGGFFSVIGIRIQSAGMREVVSWDQPILKQEKASVSGVLCQSRDGVMRYLFYGKFEPGNLHKIQISPALQVTASNLDRAHQGKKPPLAEYFEEGGKGRVVKSVEGAEDGGRFYKKVIRNMVVEVDESEEVPITDDYIWLTLPQIKKLLLVDHAMNSLSRSVCAML